MVHGRSRAGADCRGLAFLVIEAETGRAVHEPDDLVYVSTEPGDPGFRAIYEAELARWRPSPVVPLALLLFDVAGGPAHCGVALGDGLFLHTRARRGVHISHLDTPERGEPRWGSRLLGAWVHH